MQSTDLQSLSIILAMSNLQVAEGLKSALVQSQVARVFAATDNQQAVTQLGRQFYNMILIEEGFPNLGGADFCRFLRMTDGPLAVAPIIYGIIRAEKARIFAARDAGASKIVLMPLSPTILLATVQATIKERRPFVQTFGYRGPDRRTTGNHPFFGPEKRVEQQGWVSLEAQNRHLGL
ncbi:MAG: response regulator [Kordiimonadaceae bacterium]|nr:response regulator [Kordiimonadaceae bacterium]